jgi:hypothetical protein
MIVMRMFKDQKMWQQLEDHCCGTIKETLSNLELASSPKSELRELCAWSWDIWDSLLIAVQMNRSGPE